jgi:hypothetical protein
MAMDLQPTDILVKSVQGQAALADRSLGLSPRLRPLLIMVDGKRRVSDLLALGAALGDVQAALAALFDGGFVHKAVVAQAAPAPSNTALAATETVAKPPEVLTLAQARMRASRDVSDLLGPMGESLCLRLEEARSATDLAATQQRAVAVVGQARGAAVAQALAMRWQNWRLAS